MQTRLLAAILLVTLSQVPGIASAQNTLLIVGLHTKVSGTLTEANTVLNITRKNVGERKHEPIVVTREVDASSPQLYQICATSEVLPQVVFKMYKPGDHSRYKTITLRNAVLDKINGQRVTNSRGPETKNKNQTTEECSFTFQEIQVEYNLNGNTSTTDDWNSNNQ